LSPERERQLRTLFEAAIELDGSRWDAFVQRVCAGDSEMATELSMLLAAHATQGGLIPLSPTLTAPLSDGQEPDHLIGTQIGNYQIIRELGRGGMGVVYLAEQRHPISRLVALKVIKLGMDTRHVIARFESERQALALMDHPNIAKVLDAGTTPGGKPFFVMEFIPGAPITEYCDSNRMSNRQRLELFTQVCQAVQHAHQKGIIHRDIKPSNVLVCLQDGKPVPKVIDFGTAKALNRELTDRTAFTELGVLIGTPEYMSPEQAQLTGQDIDTTTDIYSLGVLLYELLGGALPFDSTNLRRAAYDEIRRIIREEEPPKPSERFSSLGAEAADVAQRRQTDVAALARELRGDLDWITMTAMAKERSRRYASASELAADIIRHLRDEPVLARPPSASYRIGKFVRKNRWPVLALAAVFASLLLGLGASTVLYFRAERQRLEAQAARVEAEREGAEAEKQRIAAEQERAEARRQSEQAENQRILAVQSRITADQQRREAELQHVEAERQRSLAEQRSIEARRRGDEAVAERAAAEKQRELADQQSQAAEAQRAAAERQRLLAQRQSYNANLIAADLHIRSNEILEARRRLYLCPPTLRGWEWRYLLWKSDSTVASLPGLTSPTEESAQVGFGPDGARLFRASAGAFEWWPIGAAKPTLTPRNFSPLLAADQHGERVLSTSGRILNTATDNTTATLDGPRFEAVCAAFDSGSHLVSGNKDGTIEIWDTASGQSRARLDAHKGGVLSVAFSADGQRIASGGEDRMLRVWDAEAAHPMYGIAGHGGAVLSVVWSVDRRAIISGSADKTARVWDAATGKPIHTLSGHECGVQAIAVNRDETTIATASCQTLRLWDARSGRLMATLPAPWHAPIASLAFNPDGGRVAAASAAGEVKVWDARTYGGGILMRIEADTDRAAVSPNGRRIAHHSAKTQTLEMWDARDRKTIWTTPESDRFTALTFSPDSGRIAAGLADGTVRVWDAATGRQTGEVAKLSAAVTWLAFAPDGARLLLGFSDRLASWDPSQRGAPSPLSIPAGPVGSSPDGKRIAIGRPSGETSIWEAGSNRLLAVLKGHSAPVEAVAFSPDASRIATASRDQTIHVWDANSYDGLLVLGNHEETVTSLVFSPDGTRLYSVSADGTVRVWDSRPGGGPQ